MLDDDGDQAADRVLTLDSGLNMPNGVAFRDGDLYVAEVNRVLRYDDIEANIETPPEPVVVNDAFPSDRAHGWKFIAFGPDGRLYVPVGGPCNVCDHEETTPIYATINSMNPDGSDLQIYARRRPPTRSALRGTRRRTSSGSPTTAATGSATQSRPTR